MCSEKPKTLGEYLDSEMRKEFGFGSGEFLQTEPGNNWLNEGIVLEEAVKEATLQPSPKAIVLQCSSAMFTILTSATVFSHYLAGVFVFPWIHMAVLTVLTRIDNCTANPLCILF